MVKRRRVQLFSCHCADFAGCDRMYYIDVELFDKIVVTPSLDRFLFLNRCDHLDSIHCGRGVLCYRCDDSFCVDFLAMRKDMQQLFNLLVFGPEGSVQSHVSSSPLSVTRQAVIYAFTVSYI